MTKRKNIVHYTADVHTLDMTQLFFFHVVYVFIVF
jgi:hypothetical protein